MVLKRQTERDQTVLLLYEAMITTYKEASDERLLWQRKQLETIYKLLFQTTNECAMFIKRYTNKNRIKRFFSLNISQKAGEFIRGFADLREQLHSGVAKDVLVVTLGVGARVDTLVMRMSLQDLKPMQQLGPKSTCMRGTRVQTINALFSWIAEYNYGILWCSGLAGTGKSSVVGTLHDLLCFHLSRRSRLAAFIRYDRTLYRNSLELIASIAYSLGMFDQRIGIAIAKALDTSCAAIKLPASESRTQFQLLVQDPLEQIQELQDEGPLVVIIDGLDESDVSTELLEVLADGFGPKLPFMRLIVSSRPEERISRVFKNSRHVHRYPLDISSEEVKHDIRHFIQKKFDSIADICTWGNHNEQQVITQLAERASGLFIWAATVCSFLCDFPSLQRLEALLRTTIPADSMEALTTLYRTALETVGSEVSGRNEDSRRCIRAVLGALIVRKGNMTVPMLPELVLQKGDPSAQFIIDRLGSVVRDEAGSLELIHKSFDDFLQDHRRCGDEWFIEVKEHEKELALRCMSSLTTLMETWIGEDQARLRHLSWVPFCSGEMAQTPHDVALSEAKDYAVNVFHWHLGALVELGINTYRSLFERYFLLWIEILRAFPDDKHSRNSQLENFHSALLKIIPIVNAEVTDQSLRTYVYHAFSFLDQSIMRPENDSTSVYKGISLSPSDNIVCRDWEGCGIDALVDKERLLAFIPFGTPQPWRLSVFQGSRYIRTERMVSCGGRSHSSKYSELFDVDTGRIVERSSAPMLCFPDLKLPSDNFISYEEMDASVQIIRLVCYSFKDKFEVPHLIPYGIIQLHDSGLDHYGDSTMFISILNTQTSRCDNYLFLGWNKGSCSVLQYRHGLFIVNTALSSALKVEPGTQAAEWVILDGCTNMFRRFTVTEDGSRLQGWTGNKSTVLLQEWETSTGSLHCEHIFVSPDGSKVAINNPIGSRMCIWEITPGSGSTDIVDPLEVIEDAPGIGWYRGSLGSSCSSPSGEQTEYNDSPIVLSSREDFDDCRRV
ncbi:hypothetical protein ARMGADRAFT_352384 [Armillaria gallica]|uniref:Nephrocystin 3-like N-terminal domain-containing protein n=1 Tax=Armillaria gallica TaxID=47427 RepID=A0A2H3DNW1_ARMGA|nr:hypothetical protein ARMGADRAFT_352384 [Armillaria gallica]